MITSIQPVLDANDWQLTLNGDKILLKLKGSTKTFEFRRFLAQKFFEELETLVRPIAFNLSGEHENPDYSSFAE